MELPHYLSLGAGVQSSTLAFMADRGEITPMPQAAFFGDTQNEPRKVYRWFEYLKANIKNFPVLDGTKGNLMKDSLRVRRSKKSGRLYLANSIPVFVKNPDGSKGILGRKCTRDYKIAVVRAGIKKHLGIKRVRSKSPILAVCWIGISLDEAERKTPSQVSWIENRWPFLEIGFTREDCIEWMAEHNYPEPPKSACKQCPYHSDLTWIRLRDEEPEDFAEAVQYEKDMQVAFTQQEVLMGTPFLHASLIPLDQVKFNPEEKKDKFNRTCEGMCGV